MAGWLSPDEDAECLDTNNVKKHLRRWIYCALDFEVDALSLEKLRRLPGSQEVRGE